MCPIDMLCGTAQVSKLSPASILDIEQAETCECQACTLSKAHRPSVHCAVFRSNSKIVTHQDIDLYTKGKLPAIWPESLKDSCRVSQIRAFPLWLQNSTIELSELSWRRVAQYNAYGRADDSHFKFLANVVHASVSINTLDDTSRRMFVERICVFQMSKQLQTLRFIFFPQRYRGKPCRGPSDWLAWTDIAQHLRDHPQLREVDVRPAIEGEILSDAGSWPDKAGLTIEEEQEFLDADDDAMDAYNWLRGELEGRNVQFRLGYQLYHQK